jgi:hypothetical protein
MNLRLFGLALLATIALGAGATSSASAENEYAETGGQWYVSGSKLTGEKSFTTSAVGTQKLETTVAGSPLDLTFTGVTTISGVFYNSTLTVATMDEIKEYTGATVSSPTGCSVSGGKVTTKPLSGKLGMNVPLGTTQLVKFVPVSGTTIAQVQIVGPSCPDAGIYELTGAGFSKIKSTTGEFAVEQEFLSSKAIQESAGTATSLKFGGNGAILTEDVKVKLAGEPTWGAKEK